jgi:hypothetical protein
MTDRASFGDRYRAGMHRAGMLWNRLVGTFLVVIGGWAALLSLGSDSFSIATHWPTFVAVGGLWLLARYFFKSREIVEPFEGDGDAMVGERIFRLDRKLGILWARVCGMLFALGGGLALLSVVTLPDFSLATYWPVFSMSALLFLGAWLCFRSRTGLMDQLSETPLSASESRARRRDVAVDDQRSREDEG